MIKLRARDPELRDLARGRVELFDAKSGQSTGVTLTRLIGVGGMAAVFAAELDPARRSSDLSDKTPHVLAIKIMKPGTLNQIDRTKESLEDYFQREIIALGRVMERTPPTELVVGCFGSGLVDVYLEDDERARVPWIAIELVSGGITGVSLTTRVEREIEGIDPLRALRLTRRIIDGVLILHAEGVIHRDLKPDNVLVAGPVDDETPKLADCGIARVEGLAGTVVGLTYAYGAPEQLLSAPGVRNPLIGIWTDVHALAGVVWFILAGEDWCRSEDDTEWGQGQRRSLRSSARLHPGLLAGEAIIDRIDEVLQRGAAPKLPAAAWSDETTKRRYEAAIRLHLPSMLSGVDRYESVQAFAADLLPLLEEVAAGWKARSVREKRPPTALRPTYLPAAETPQESLVTVREQPLRLLTGAAFSAQEPPLSSNKPVLAAYQPDGKALGLFGEQLMSIVHEEACTVPLKPSVAPMLVASKWLVRGPRAGFALVGPSHVLLIGRDAEPTSLLPPRRDSGESAGSIVAAVGDGRIFGVVTAEGGDSGADPELWLSEDGVEWTEPAELPLGGVIHAIASGHFGFLVVGMRRAKARALFMGYDGTCRIVTKHVIDRSPLWAAVCGTGRDSWAAGEDVILRFDGDTAEPEPAESQGRPVAMGLDLVGTPWLVTQDTALRRHAGIAGAKWKLYYRRDPGRPALAAIGFTPEGAHVLDAAGNSVLLVPHDIDRWGS